MTKLEVYILPLLCCSIYLAFHLFGINNFYSYPQFNKTSIFLNSIYIGILFFFLSKFYYSILIKLPKKYFNFLNTLTISIFIFLTITLLFKFADINHGFLLENIFGDKIKKIIYLSIFFGFFVFIFLRKEKNTFNYYKFLYYLLTIITALLYLRLYNLEIHLNIKNDYKNFVNEHQVVYKDKKAILVIFDELDYQILENNLDKFPTLKSFVNTSFYHKNFYSNHNNTLQSIPEIFTGVNIKKTKFDNGKILYQNQKGKFVYYNNKNTIFNDLDNRGLKSDIFGMYHPYCKTFVVQQCFDVNNFKLSKISFLYSLQLVLNQFYLTNIGINTNKIRIKLEHIINKFIKTKENTQIKDLNDLVFENINFLDDLSYNQFRFTKDFVQSSGDFIFIHYPYPHPIVKILPNSQTKNKINNDYLLNIFLVEKTVESIISSANLLLNDKVLLIITTDHWLREAYEEKLGKQKIFFASKILGDNNNLNINKKQTLTSVKDLIVDFFDKKINSNHDILNYFVNR